MEGFPQVTALLEEAIKDSVKFQWTQDCQRSFELVKAMLSGVL